MKKKATITAMVLLTAVAVCFNSYATRPQKGVSPHLIIYKTKEDYSKYVPVTLSPDKSKVISYPDPRDVYFNGSLAYPTALADGYWLDNRGIGPNSAFIKLTYEQYAGLPHAPDVAQLYSMIIDKDPFTEIINMSSRYQYKDAVAEINHLIRKHRLGKFERIK